MFSLFAILQNAPAGAPRMLPNLIMIAAFIAIFYFLLLRPQRKIQQEHRSMLSQLKKGDEVVTEGGIVGQIVHLTDDRATIKSAENTRLVILRGKISRVLTQETTEAKQG
jgi:preprotein translocase subunit YajC